MGLPRQSVGAGRGAVAAAAAASGCGGVAYWLIGDRSVDRPGPGLARFVGPIDVPARILTVGLVVATLVGIVSACVLLRWIHGGRVRRGWAVIALGGCAATVISAWTWRVLTAAYVVVSPIQIWLALAAAAAAWTVVLVGATPYVLSARDDPAPRRGCDYCARDDNLRHGDVHVVSANEHQRTVLMQCPRCGWLYTAAATQPETAEPISEADARDLFPSTW